MSDIRRLRVEAFNRWPADVAFPALEAYLNLLAKKNIRSPMAHCDLNYVDDSEFHFYLAYLIDGLESLPNRPDKAFESFYIPLEREMNRIKGLAGNHNASRFVKYKDFLLGLDKKTIVSLAKFIELAPLQICEFAASRILSADKLTQASDSQIVKRGKDALGEEFYSAYCKKYSLSGVAGDHRGKAENQRKAGALLQLALAGEEVHINGVRFSGGDVDRIGILSTFILPSIRNDRFHGNVFPSYRSSAYKMKNFAGSQFACTISFLLVLLSISSRWQVSITPSSLQGAIDENSSLFKSVFGDVLRK